MATKVLIVDNDQAILTRATETLESVGYTVLSSSNAESGLAKAMADSPSLILISLTIPGTNGLELCKNIHNTPVLAGIPIILLTLRDGSYDPSYKEKFGIVALFKKPFETVSLMNIVQEHCPLAEETMADETMMAEETITMQPAQEAQDEGAFSLADSDQNLGDLQASFTQPLDYPEDTIDEASALGGELEDEGSTSFSMDTLDGLQTEEDLAGGQAVEEVGSQWGQMSSPMELDSGEADSTDTGFAAGGGFGFTPGGAEEPDALAGGEADFSAGGGADLSAGGKADFSTGGEADFSAGGEADFSAGGEADFSAGGEADFSAGGEADFSTGGEADFSTGGEEASTGFSETQQFTPSAPASEATMSMGAAPKKGDTGEYESIEDSPAGGFEAHDMEFESMEPAAKTPADKGRAKGKTPGQPGDQSGEAMDMEDQDYSEFFTDETAKASPDKSASASSATKKGGKGFKKGFALSMPLKVVLILFVVALIGGGVYFVFFSGDTKKPKTAAPAPMAPKPRVAEAPAPPAPAAPTAPAAPVAPAATKPAAPEKPGATTKAPAKPAEEPKAAAPAKTTTAASGYYIQFGAFKEKVNADRMMGSLTKSGFSATIEKVSGKTGTLHYVLLADPFSSRKDAGSKGKEFKNMGYEIAIYHKK